MLMLRNKKNASIKMSAVFLYPMSWDKLITQPLSFVKRYFKDEA